MYDRIVDTAIVQHRAGEIGEFVRPAHEPLIDRWPTYGVEQAVQLRAIKASAEQRRLARFARQHMKNRKTVREAIFQIGEIIEEHHRLHNAVGIDQGERTRWFGLEGRRDYRQHRCDAAAGDDGATMPRQRRIKAADEAAAWGITSISSPIFNAVNACRENT